jgi:hypothetical protein
MIGMVLQKMTKDADFESFQAAFSPSSRGITAVVELIHSRGFNGGRYAGYRNPGYSGTSG